MSWFVHAQSREAYLVIEAHEGMGSVGIALSVTALLEAWGLADERCFPMLINATKEGGESIDYLLAIVDDVFDGRLGLYSEICQCVFENWGLSPDSE